VQANCLSDIGVIIGQKKFKTIGECSTNERGEKYTKNVWQEPGMEKPLGRHTCITYDDIKMHLKEVALYCRLNVSTSEQTPETAMSINTQFTLKADNYLSYSWCVPVSARR